MERGGSFVIRIWPISLLCFLLKDTKGFFTKSQELGMAFWKRRAGEGRRDRAAPHIQVCHQ